MSYSPTQAEPARTSRGKPRFWWMWQGQRTVLFWIIGAINTVFLLPEHVGGWRNWMGWLFITLAVIDTFRLLWVILRRRGSAEGGDAD